MEGGRGWTDFNECDGGEGVGALVRWHELCARIMGQTSVSFVCMRRGGRRRERERTKNDTLTSRRCPRSEREDPRSRIYVPRLGVESDETCEEGIDDHAAGQGERVI
jgi:hypothetical protein